MLLIIKILMALTIVGGLGYSFRVLFISNPNQKLLYFVKAISITVLAALILAAAEFYLEKK